MAKRSSVRERLRVRPAKGQLTLADIDPDATPGSQKASAKADKDRDAEKLRQLQERLYAEGTRSLLLVLQGMDTSGKGPTSRSSTSSAPSILKAYRSPGSKRRPRKSVVTTFSGAFGTPCRSRG